MAGPLAGSRSRMTIVPVSGVMLVVVLPTTTVAARATDVAVITCGVSATGTQLVAVSPSGSGQLWVSGCSSTGIAPVRNRHASVSGVAGRQSGEVKLALLIAPVVPAIRSATRLALLG